MTSDLIFDSCVVAKLVLVEDDSHLANAVLSDAYNRHAGVWMLDLAFAEVGNVIWKACRQKRLSEAAAHQALLEVLDFRLEVLIAKGYLKRSLEIALKYQIAMYDALFVAAVEQEGCRGVTSDAALIRRLQPDFPQIELLA